MIFFEKSSSRVLHGKNIPHIFALAFQERAISSAGSEHLPYKQGVVGSNPTSPTINYQRVMSFGFITLFYLVCEGCAAGTLGFLSFLFCLPVTITVFEPSNEVKNNMILEIQAIIEEN